MSVKLKYFLVFAVASLLLCLRFELYTGAVERKDSPLHGTVNLIIRMPASEVMVVPAFGFELYTEAVERKDSPLHGTVNLTIRMPASEVMVERFFCMLLRSASIFWDHKYGDVVIILDEADKSKTYFPKYLTTSLNLPFKYNIIYENAPRKVKEFEKAAKRVNYWYGYFLQLYSFFIMDLYFKDDEIIAYIDTDATFTMPIVDESILENGKIIVKGVNTFVKGPAHVANWDAATKLIFGLPMVSDFMTFFPTYFYPRTVRNCRNYIMKRFNVTDFEDAFVQLYPFFSPVNIVFTYAYYFEHDSYSWHIDTFPQTRDDFNKRRLPAHPLQLNDVQPEMHQTVHAKYYKKINPLEQGVCYLQIYLGMKNLIHCGQYGEKPVHLLYEFCTGPLVNHFNSWLTGNIRVYSKRIVEMRYDIIKEKYRRNLLEFKSERIKAVEDYAKKHYGKTCPKIKYQPFTTV